MPMNDGSFKNKMIQNFLKTMFLIPHLYMYHISQMLSILIIACYISDIDWLQHWCRCNIFRARLTLPQSMQAVDLPGQEVAVLTQGPISKNTHYGPFEAKKTTHEFSDDSLFLLKVVQQLMILELLVRLLMESFFNFLYFMPCSLSQ